MSKPIYILGTSNSHDGSSCLMKDGEIVVAIEKERLTKIKHDGFDDNETIDYCLSSSGITANDLDLVVFEDSMNFRHKESDIKKVGKRNIPPNIPTLSISHHLAHAYSAIGMSPFEETAVLVIDGQGGSVDKCLDYNNCKCMPSEYHDLGGNKEDYWEYISYYEFSNGVIKPLFKDFAKFNQEFRKKHFCAPEDMEHSVGEFYDGISNYIFNKRFSDGKTMGLAPDGRKNVFFHDAFDFFDLRVRNRKDWYGDFPNFRAGRFQGLYEGFQYFSDIAFWAQSQLEKAVVFSARTLNELSDSKNLSYAGGVALNAVANPKIIENTSFEDIFIQPAAADNGLSIGCCYYGWLEHFGKKKVKHKKSVYLGREYTSDNILNEIKKHQDLSYMKSKNIAKNAADLLQEGNVIAWFQGGSEFGPRALGNRSILADPRKKDVRNYINRSVKHREDFRPFAPSILEDQLHNFFDCKFVRSPHMLQVAKAKPGISEIIPAVVHVDGTSRVQTVSQRDNTLYAQLISEFSKISGIPILLNTSLNGANMPIVETPKDAVEFFRTVKNLDYLIIGDFIVKRGDL